MSIIEQIKAEIKRQISDLPDTWSGSPAAKWAFEALLSFLSTLESEKPMNQEGLEEEIQRFLSNATKMDKGEWKGKYPISEMGFSVVARHFAKWGAERQKEQMMKGAIPCKVFWHDGPLLDYTQEQQDNALERISANVGDKVRIIIVKED